MVLELVIELVVELFGEGLLDLAIHAVSESDRARRRALRIVMCALAGAAIGAASIYFFPTHFIRNPTLRLAGLAVTPTLAGAIFGVIGNRRRRNEKRVTAIEAFWPAFAFALAMGVVRYFGTA